MVEADFEARIRALLARIPPGSVATYGQLAALAGYPRRARAVGRVLRFLPRSSGLPWHRVINAQGRVAARNTGLDATRKASRPRHGPSQGSPEAEQERLLRKDGIPLPRGRIDLKRYGWKPEQGALFSHWEDWDTEQTDGMTS